MARLLLALGLLLGAFAPVSAQVDAAPAPADTGVVGVRALPVEPYTLILPPAFSAPWLAGPRYLAPLAAQQWGERLSRYTDSVAAAAAYARLQFELAGIEVVDSAALAAEKGLFGINRKVVDLVIDGTVRLELRSERLRNERCTPQALADPTSGCRAGFSAPRLDNQIALRVGGVLGQRLRLNVDWDTQRDFVNANNIQVYYEGLEDELVRRVEVGSVNFRPPPSRFLTATLPSNNFGVNAVLEFGPVQLQAMGATQKGSAVAERTFTIGGTAVQPQDRSQRDLDFEYGRFFWVVDPRGLPGYPAIDPLTLDTLRLPASVRPAQVRVYRYRVPAATGTSDPNLGGIDACGRQGTTARTVGPVQWQVLVLGIDYYLDPSGLWFALAQRVDLRADYIAVSYVTEDGTVVGSFPDRPNPNAGITCAEVDSLQLVVEPLVDQSQPSFHHELRGFYRVAGQDMEIPSLRVSISVNRSERPLAPNSFGTYLAALGLSVPTDANVVDTDNRLFPRVRDPGAATIVREAFVVFPHLQPFANPQRLQPAERNDSLYRTPVFLLFNQGPPALFSFRFQYNAAGSGDRTSLSLNALQIREGTEQLFLGGRRLERGVDYEIAYETGQVTFLNPARLFGSGTGAVTLQARFEERGVFAIAPTSIYGLSARYDLGRTGAVNLVGIYQQEQSAFTRPQLGFEAAANLVAGANAELHFRPSGITRFLNSFLPSRALGESFLDFNAEVALTRPDPNRTGEAYLEEFEAESGVPVNLRENLWEYGSVPTDALGLPPQLGIGDFDPEDAVQLSWQTLVPAGDGTAVEIFSPDIDPNLQTAGRQTVPETVMYLTLHADTAGGVVQRDGRSRWTQPERPGRPRWRTLQTALSAVGVDFTRNEFIEFWVFQDGSQPADAADVQLVFDLGSVSEDALAVAPTTLTPLESGDTTYTGRQYVGQGVLDTERRPNGIFNAESDDLGILGDVPTLVSEGEPLDRFPLCQTVLGTAVPIFPWGDLSARCTRGDGFLSTEDLDGDNTLNARGAADNVFRYVVGLRDPRYFVRNGVVDPVSGAGWRLYRVPLRSPDAVVGSPNLRLVQHLRMTVAAPDQGGPDRVARLALARFRFVGSPWVRRADAPIAGIAGSTAEPTGEIVSAIISTADSTDLGYVSPPGVGAAVDRRDQVGGQQGSIINERALRIIARQLRQGTRAEAFLRFPAGAQRFLGYRQLRVWMRGRPGAPGWETGDLQGFVKVGSDDRNFYSYRQSLKSAGGREAWEPELVADLDVWRRLRAEVESRWLNGEPPSGAAECGGDPAAYVACDGPYLVHVGSPGVNPPNLSAVQEVAAGMIRLTPGTSDSTEVWVNDIRLSGPVAETGVAYAVEGRLAAADVFDIAVSALGQNGQFRQIGAQPSFRTTNGINVATNVQLDRFLPQSVGLLMPLQVTYTRSTVDPELLTGTDIEGKALPRLRRPASDLLAMSLLLRRSVRSGNAVARLLVDPLALSASYSLGNNLTEFSRTTSNAYALALSYTLTPQAKRRRLNLGGLVNGLPRWLRDSDLGQGLRGGTWSPVPSNVRLSSGLARDSSDFFSYAVPVTRDTDAALVPALALSHVWRNAAGLNWQPLGMLALGANLSSTRDLREYGDSTSLGRLATAERQSVLGIDAGVERDRQLTTQFALTPKVASWLRPRFSTTSNFALVRNLNSRQPVRAIGDTAGAFFLPQTYNNQRALELGFSIDYARGLRQVAGDSSGLANVVRRFRPFDVSWRRARSSTYDLATFDPDLRFQLALGGIGEFLFQQGTQALGATDQRGTTISTGLDFPFGLAFTLNYSETEIDRYQRVTGGGFLEALTTQREWPSGTARFTRSFRRGPFALVAVGMAWRDRQGATQQPSLATSSFTANQSRAVTPDLQLTFRNGLALLSNLNLVNQEAVNNGNATFLEQTDVSGTMSYGFRLPFRIGRERKLARSSVTALLSRADQCLLRRDAASCEVISDTRREEYRASLDTDIVSMATAGLQVGYTTNELRHLDRKTSQIFLNVTFTLSLFAGDYR